MTLVTVRTLTSDRSIDRVTAKMSQQSPELMQYWEEMLTVVQAAED